VSVVSTIDTRGLWPEIELERRAFKVLDIIVAEFTTDPMSVQCFDLRTVEEAKRVIADRCALELAGKVPPLLVEKQ
jgi:hypothetical protein